jgi:hypothetical protein
MAKRRFSRDAWRRRASHDAFYCVSSSDTAFDVFIAELLFPYLPKYAKRVSDQPIDPSYSCVGPAAQTHDIHRQQVPTLL